MQTEIHLDEPIFIPNTLRHDLEPHLSLLKSCDFMEEIIKRVPVQEIAAKLEEFIGENIVIGYHCTQEPEPGYFIAQGLRILNRESHQAQFRTRYGSQFSCDQWTRIESAWSSYFPGAQDRGRNGKLWFCMSAHTVVNACTHYFFEYFGGEAVYMPLIDTQADIAAKLRSLGRAVVVEVRVRPRALTTFSLFPFALEALSHYHRQINPSAHIHYLEGYLSRNVTPSQIVRVVPKEDFFREHAVKRS